ncbi:hypothetical protein D3C75_1369120 [compost metagenome]
MQPQKLVGLGRLAELAQQLRRIDLATGLAWAEGKSIEQAEQVVILLRVQRGMTHSNSQ